jgi:hypothetical protein
MKIKIIIIIIAILPLLSLAQKNELLLGLSIGMNQPLGEFTNNEVYLNDAGELVTEGQFAKTGLAFDLSVDYRMGYYLGFAGRIMGGTNKIDVKTYTDVINQGLEPEGLESTISSKGWGNGGIYFGAYFVIPIQNLYIDFRAMGGYMNLFSPEIRYYVYETNVDDSELFIREKYNAGGFSYDFGLGLKYKFGGNKFLLLNGDYVAATIKKDQIETLNPFTQEPELVNMDIDYQNLTFTIGLGYIF